MRVGKEERTILPLASFSPSSEVAGETFNAHFWTCRLNAEKFHEYLMDFEARQDFHTFILNYWLTPLEKSSSFTKSMMYTIEHITEFGEPLPTEQRAMEDLIYINAARLFIMTDERDTRLRASTRTFSRCVEFIDQHLADDFTVIDLARFANLSVRSLQYLFNKTTNTSVTQFISERRLQKARRLLESADQRTTVQIVASLVGIPNASYFAKRYQARFGVAPRLSLRRKL